MQFDDAGVIKRRVKWFFAAPGAKHVPGGTVFSSSNYGDLAGGQLGPGEDWTADRPWRDGSRPQGLDGDKNVCGPEDWFHVGTPSDAPTPAFVGPIAPCCGPPPARGTVGIKVSPSWGYPCLYPPNSIYVFAKYGGKDWLPPTAGTFPSWVWYTPTVFPQDTYSMVGISAANVQKCLTGTWYDGSIAQGGFQLKLLGPVLVDRGNQVYGFVVDSPFWPFDDHNFIVRFSALPHAFSLGIKAGLGSRVPMVAGRLGAKLGLMSGDKGAVAGAAGLKLGLTTRPSGRYAGAAGVKVGLDGMPVNRVAGEAGLQLGLQGITRGIYIGEAGLQLGLAGVERGRYHGTVGVKAGLAGVERGRYHGTVGVKAGLAGVERGRYHGTVGVKAGLAGVGRVKTAATAGLKLGLASAPFGGILTSCCPGVGVPLTLTGTGSNGGAVTATWSAGSGGWTFIDPGTSLGCTLKCVNIGASFQWQVQMTPAGCSHIYVEVSKVCHPFAISTTTQLFGGSCFFVGTYHFTLHA